jgi:hypothetical protein
MRAEVLALWPSAPIAEAGASGRWLRLEAGRGAGVYLQRYGWEEPCAHHFLVVVAPGLAPDRGPVRQARYFSLGEAVEALRALVAERAPAARRAHGEGVVPSTPAHWSTTPWGESGKYRTARVPIQDDNAHEPGKLDPGSTGEDPCRRHADGPTAG